VSGGGGGSGGRFPLSGVGTVGAVTSPAYTTLPRTRGKTSGRYSTDLVQNSSALDEKSSSQGL